MRLKRTTELRIDEHKVTIRDSNSGYTFEKKVIVLLPPSRFLVLEGFGLIFKRGEHGSKNSLNWGLDKLIVHYWRFWCEWITGFGPWCTNDVTDLYFHNKCIFWHVFWLLVYYWLCKIICGIVISGHGTYCDMLMVYFLWYYLLTLHCYDDFVNGQMMMLAAGFVVLTGLFMTHEIYYQWNGFRHIKINEINTCSQRAHKHINNGLKCTA